MCREHLPEDEILQLLPADGWYAYSARGDKDGQPFVEEVPLVCWALLCKHDEGGAYHSIEGFVAGEFVESAETCLAYGRAGGGQTKEWRDAAGDWLRAEGIAEQSTSDA